MDIEDLLGHSQVEQLGLRLKVKRIHLDAIVPEYATKGSAGLDLRAITEYNVLPGKTVLIKTGLAVEIPIGYVGNVCSRSGLALKQGIFVLNSPGIIDNDYNGDNDEIGVILHNAGENDFIVNVGDRIAQLVISPAPKVYVVEVENLNEKDRGGFGTTGKE